MSEKRRVVLAEKKLRGRLLTISWEDARREKMSAGSSRIKDTCPRGRATLQVRGRHVLTKAVLAGDDNEVRRSRSADTNWSLTGMMRVATTRRF